MTHEEVKEILLSKKWKNTTTFKTYPHSYSLDFEWEDQELFQKVWKYINDKGERRLFFWSRLFLNCFIKTENDKYKTMSI